MIYCKIAI